ncbi:hypothetical protein EMIT048CA2_110139 [Pseudomonas chlororaphis]
MSRQRHPATGVLPLQWPRGDPIIMKRPTPHEHRPRTQPRSFILPSPADGLIPQDPFSI